MPRTTRLSSGLAAGIAALALAGGVVAAPAEASASSTTTTTVASSDDVATITAAQVAAAKKAAAEAAAAKKAAAEKLAAQKAAAARAAAQKAAAQKAAAAKAAALAARCSLGSSSTGTSCDTAIAFMTAQMTSGSTSWHDLCLRLVSEAYGDVWSGYPTASSVASALSDAGKLHTTTDVTTIPRGAVLWLTNSSGAGHVAISLGNGKAISSDVPNGDISAGSGGVGIVSISYFTNTWGQTLLGWSAPVAA